MHREAFYTTVAQILPTMLIVVVLELRGWLLFFSRLAKVRPDDDDPEMLNEFEHTRTGLAAWGFITGVVFVTGEAAAFLPLMTGLDGGFVTACGVTALGALLFFSVLAIVLPIWTGLMGERKT